MKGDNNPRDEWDAMAEVTRRPVCAPAERDEHTTLRAAVAAERAAVVAWLRSTVTARLWRQEPMDAAADAIERGEHRREEAE
jgi:hypothetical protein